MLECAAELVGLQHLGLPPRLDQRDELLNTLNKLIEKQSRTYKIMYTKRDWRVMTQVDAARDDLRRCERAVVLAREAALASDPGPSCFVVFATQKAAQRIAAELPRAPRAGTG